MVPITDSWDQRTHLEHYKIVLPGNDYIFPFQVKRCDGKVFFETLEYDNPIELLNLKCVERIFVAVYCNENFVVRSRTGKNELDLHHNLKHSLKPHT